MRKAGGQFPTGYVTFRQVTGFLETRTLGTVRLRNGSASFDVQGLPVGVGTYRASFKGNGAYLDAYGEVEVSANNL
jgi:hypothetical protein